MKLEQLIILTDDAHPITNTRRVSIIPEECGIVCASGNWYMDHIMNYCLREVVRYEVDLLEDKITITVKGDMIL